MKKLVIVAVSLMFVVFGSVIAASPATVPSLTLKVPFEFYAGNHLLPAGEYVIEMLRGNSASAAGSIIAVRARDGSIYRLLQTLPRASSEVKPPYHVIFTRLGDTYFLSKVQNSGVEINLPQTHTEREMAAGRPKSAKPVVIAGV